MTISSPRPTLAGIVPPSNVTAVSPLATDAVPVPNSTPLKVPIDRWLIVAASAAATVPRQNAISASRPTDSLILVVMVLPPLR